MRRRTLALLTLWVALTAAAPAPPVPPPPDVVRLIPFAVAPLEKPPVVVTLPLPAVPVDFPPFPPAAVTMPAVDKPVAFIAAPRTLPCVGAWLGIASESLECGRARFQNGELDEAARRLEHAVRTGSEPPLLREARYWLGETYWRLGRTEQADWLFRQVAQDGPRQEWAVWALHSSGWSALKLRDAARAREAFTHLLAGSVPSPLEAWGRHGLALALYALGRYDEAEQAWTMLETRGVPPPLLRDVAFWHGDTYGRVGRPKEAATSLHQFTQGGVHPLLAPGLLRLGWWRLAAGQPAEALAAFRAFLGQPPTPERDWGEAGLGLAHLASGDWAGARQAAATLRARSSPLAEPMLFRVARVAAESAAPADADAVFQELLGARLQPAARAWVLVVKGEMERARGNRDEARTSFDLAQKVDPASAMAQQAGVREAMTNFDLREFAQAVTDVTPVANARSATPDVHLAALLLLGEAAYHAGDHVASAAAFRRALVEFPNDPRAPLVRLAAAWALLRQGLKNDARRELLEFASVAPDHPHAVDALVLGSELMLETGNLVAAQRLLDRVIGSYPTHPRTDFARLNRGLVLLRAGDGAGAAAAIRDWLGRAADPALFGRAHAGLAAALLATGALDEAQREFTLAHKDGMGSVGQLGIGSVALLRGRYDEAQRAFEAARDTGTPPEAAAAAYGIAAVGAAKGNLRPFKQPARTALASTPPGPAGAARAGSLLYVLTAIAVEEKDWTTALTYARRLASEYRTHASGPDALERVGAGSAAAHIWPVAYESTLLLRQTYPEHPLAQAAWLRLAEAQIELGRAAEARPALERFVTSSPAAPEAPRAWAALARARQAAGDRAGALEAYTRAPQPSGTAPDGPVVLGHARLLLQEKRWDEARGVVDRLLKSSDAGLVAEAAQTIGDAYTGEGDHLAASEYYLTAVYVAPDAPAARRGLLSAARAFAVLKQEEAAAAAYRKLLAQADVPIDIREAARQGLAALGRSAQ